MKFLYLGLIDFIKGCNRFNIFWRIWLAILLTSNIFLPLMFLEHKVAIVTISSALAGAITGFILTYKNGFNKFLGLMHTPWIPMVVFQFLEIRELTSYNGNFEKWLILSFSVSVISILIDIVDVNTYLKSTQKN